MTGVEERCGHLQGRGVGSSTAPLRRSTYLGQLMNETGAQADIDEGASA